MLGDVQMYLLSEHMSKSRHFKQPLIATVWMLGDANVVSPDWL